MSASPKVVRAAAGRPIQMLGNQVLFKLTGQDTDNQFTLIEATNAPDSGIPLHRHAHEDETFFVAEGTVEFVIGAARYTLGAGDLVFAPRHLPHSYRVVSELPAKILTQLSPAGLEHLFEALSELPAGPPNQAQVAAICARYGVTFE